MDVIENILQFLRNNYSNTVGPQLINSQLYLISIQEQ